MRIWLATGHTDMRRGMPGLALLVQEARSAATRSRATSSSFVAAAAATKDGEIPGVRIALQGLLHLQRQAVHAATHVGVAVGQPGPRVARRHDHRRAAAITRRKAIRPKSSPTRMQVPSSNAISIRLASTTTAGPPEDAIAEAISVT